MHRTHADDRTGTNSKMSGYLSIDEKAKKINSVNGIEPTLRNVDKLFRAACKKTKEGFQLKRFGWDLPEHLQSHFLPVEALAFDRDVLLLISKEMGIKLTTT